MSYVKIVFVIKGMRIKVSFILELIFFEWTIDQILQEYKHLSREQIIVCLIYAGHVVDIHKEEVKIPNII
ncbi:MAG: DUF433 domain-containing protein [Candidatus Helarchaeota archaeon]